MQAIEAALKGRFFLPDQDPGDVTAAYWALRQGVSCRERASLAPSPIHRLPESGTVEDGSCATSSILARASISAGVCVLWLLIGAAEDKGLCGESSIRVQALVASTEKARKVIEPHAMRGEALLVSQVVETTAVEQKQILERGREKIDIQQVDVPQGKAAQAPQSAPTRELKQALEHESEWNRAEALARALTASLRGELDAVRSTAEAARIKQEQALDQERDRADALARELDKVRVVSLEAVQAIDAETKQRQALEQERGRADNLAGGLTSLRAELDAARNGGSGAVQTGEAESKQRQALEQERGRADSLASELTYLRAELDAARNKGSEAAQAVEAESKQKSALEQELKQERGRADILASDLTSLRAEFDAARNKGSETAQAVEAEGKQKQALEQELKQERDRADTLARELTSVGTELDAARTAGPKVAQVAAAEVEQKQALKRELEQQRDRVEALTRELTSLRAELDKARAEGGEAVRIAEAARIEQEQAFRKERDKTEARAHELASARKETERRSALLAAAYTEVLQAMEKNSTSAAEQKLAIARERDRADALSRELARVRNGPEAGNWQIAALNAFRALRTQESPVDSAQARMVEVSSRTTEEKGRSAEQVSGGAVASTSERSSASELPRLERQSAAREAASDLDQKVGMGTERSMSASAATRSPVDEQRLLARATELLRQADISGARPLLEHALAHGSARAAFMLAETYDARVLQSWRARGISGDLAKARELYEQAQAGGIEDAKARIEALK
jgi:hypothetical protein